MGKEEIRKGGVDSGTQWKTRDWIQGNQVNKTRDKGKEKGKTNANK
jgi:hypothetical protein